jgi:hypothetical protein
MPLTEEQRRALPELRAMFASTEHTFGSSMPFDKRAHLPTTGIPEDITAHVEIAPPLSAPLPLIDSSALKNPERVPIFYYSLRNEKPTASAPEDTKVIFFVHGGGNVVNHPTSIQYTDLFAAMLRALATGSGNSVPCTIIAPCYRLATVPENTFPAALQDILAAYDFVISQGYKSSNITVAGDSAGGNHGERFDPLPTRHRIDRVSRSGGLDTPRLAVQSAIAHRRHRYRSRFLTGIRQPQRACQGTSQQRYPHAVHVSARSDGLYRRHRFCANQSADFRVFDLLYGVVA